MRPIAPSLEDVFVRLTRIQVEAGMKRSGDAAAGGASAKVQRREAPYEGSPE